MVGPGCTDRGLGAFELMTGNPTSVLTRLCELLSIPPTPPVALDSARDHRPLSRHSRPAQEWMSICVEPASLRASSNLQPDGG